MSDAPPAAARIVVIGATGFTGRLVAAELAEPGGGMAPGADSAGAAGPDPGGGARSGDPAVVLAGRDRERAERLARGFAGAEAAVVDVTEAEALARLIRPGDAVINCAGPFAELGEPVVARCVAAGASYVDTSGEQPWMREMRDRYHERAAAARVAVVNGMAFEWALGDCGAALLARRLEGGLSTLDVIYGWAGAGASRGTRRTAIRILGTRAWALHDGRWRRPAPGSRRRRVTLGEGRERTAITFGAGEIVTVPRWSEPRTVRGWVVVGRRIAAVAPALSPVLPLVVPVLRPLLERLATRASDPTPAERAASRFTIRLEGTGAAGGRAALEIRGTDPYGLTAAIAVAGARRCLEPGRPAGVLAPSQLLSPERLFHALGRRGVEVAPER